MSVSQWFNGREMIGTIPPDAVAECTTGGVDASGPVDDWVRSLEFDAPVTETREYLAGYGAWDAAELADHDANVRRLFWIACGTIADGDDSIYLDS